MEERSANPYPFIHRIDGDDGAFRCEHKEATGLFKPKHLTVKDLSEIETLHAALLGGAFHDVADKLAQRQAWVHYGFETTPDVFEVKNIRSEALLHALFVEVKSFHDYFREPALEDAVGAAAGTAA